MFFLAPIALLAPAAVSDATTPTTPTVDARDPTTDVPLLPRDATGQPLVRTDATGQPLVRTDDTGQTLPPPEGEETILQRPDSLIRQMSGSFNEAERERLRDSLLGGHEWREQVALIQGYNTNVFQTQNVVNGPGIAHPSMFTGADASAEYLTWSSLRDQQTFRLQVRGQHYEPLDGDSISDDGSAIGSFTGQYSLSERTYLQIRGLATVTTTNSAQLSDGPLFQIDPSSLQRIYTLEDARIAIVHELSPTWRWITGADVEFSTTIRDVPIELSSTNFINHHGLDYITPAIDTALFHDFDEANVGTVMLRYEPTYVAFLVNPTTSPPTYNGYTTVEMGEATVGWIHGFNERFRSWTTVGVTLSSPPPFDTDTRPIESPLFSEELTYVSNNWISVLGLTYAYGSANPRLGFGPSVSAGLTMEGVPYPHGAWRNFSVLASVTASRSIFLETPTELSRLSYLADAVEFRYGVNNWLGLLGGYQGRWVVFEGADAYPSLLRHVLFFGVSGYFSSDRTLPTLNTFTSPVTPPG